MVLDILAIFNKTYIGENDGQYYYWGFDVNDEHLSLIKFDNGNTNTIEKISDMNLNDRVTYTLKIEYLGNYIYNFYFEDILYLNTALR